ncbi:DDB1- and CUL4-associated factor 5-like [Anneissia japonica]|uniref:DDB1- and CUL4-associated factor 5-like n=1 Tax=Anneissia japonica TaxID=1529436 RepID=UPI001425960A|nr:DDB1- and CUL4-associated factor 5-like [Anneissia japonica]
MAQRQWAKKKTTMSVLSYHQNRQITDDLQFTSQFLSRRFASSEGLFRKNLMGHFGCINAIEFSNKGGNFLASGGDDRRIVLWNMQDAISNVGSAHFSNHPESSRNKLQKKLKTVTLRGEHHSNIFSLAFDSQNKNIFSGGNDAQVLVHDMQT